MAYGGNQYSCSPRCISEYIATNNRNDFELIWLFSKDNLPSNIDGRIKVVIYLTLQAVVAINTAEFVITNKRTDPRDYGWIKKKGQKYVMTWHGDKPIKKIELDAIETLGSRYLNRMKRDSAYCDLFLSGSKYTTNIYRNSFLYKGEILEKGVPRNDIFFDKQKHKAIKKTVFDHFGFSEGDVIVLYSPTFRGNLTLEYYNIDWKRVVPAFEDKFCGTIKVLIRLHPNFLSSDIDRSSLFNNDCLYEATGYGDINDLIIASDVMISDYSSCIFDFAFMERPCFLYAVDSAKYERGFYLDIRDLPFPFSENNDELVCNINSFEFDFYRDNLRRCMRDKFVSYDTGHATEAVVEWMLKKKNDVLIK